MKDYHYDVWYDYSVDVPVVSEEDIADSFDRLREQVDTKEANGGTCTSNLSGKYDVTYYKEPEITEYVLDRNTEYTTVLAANDTIRVYEDNTLLQTNETIEVTGLNKTVVVSVEGSTVESYRYDDYGQSESSQGHGYNGEIKDETGLIYLRARYYDPDMGRFIQIDNNYRGEKEEVVTQNRYTYTLNNPYKYVDRDGNFAIADDIVFWMIVGGIAILVTGAAVAATSNLTTMKRVFGELGDKIKTGAEKIGEKIVDGVEAISNYMPRDILNTDPNYRDLSNVQIECEDKNKDKESKRTVPNQLQKQVENGQAPKGVDRVDKGNTNDVEDAKDHIHFKNQKPTLNSDGSWGHLSNNEEPPKLSNKVKKWLKENGWTLPE